MKTWIFLFITISSVIRVSHGVWTCSSSSSNSLDTEETSAGSSGGNSLGESVGNGGLRENWDGQELGPFGTPSRQPGAYGGGSFDNRIYDGSGEESSKHRKNLDKHFGEPGVNDMYYGRNTGEGNEVDDNPKCPCDKKLNKKEKNKQKKEEKRKKQKEKKEKAKRDKEEKKQRQREEKERRAREKKEKKKKCKCKRHKKHK